MSWAERLRARERETGRPVRVALVGAGQMGRGLAAQVGRIPGLHLSVVADVDPARVATAFEDARIATAVLDPALGTDALARIVDDGGHVGVHDADTVPSLPVDVVVEATGIPEVSARLTLASLLNGKDVVALTIECDVTVGLFLARLARSTGRVYTVARGDEPVEAKRLVDHAQDLGFEIVCAGKGKNNPLRPDETPDRLTVEAAAKGMNPRILCEFVDGSKTMIEMAALANATGLQVSRRGLYGPPSTVATLHETFALRADGGILDRPGVVDYCTGPVAPGVFVVVRSEHPYVTRELDYLHLGRGPYYAFYRPYHLASVEAPLSIPQAVLDRSASLQTRVWSAEVAAAAKRDLVPGEVIDGIGGHLVRGVIEDAAVAAAEHLVPLGVLQGARVVRPVPHGAALTYDDVALDETSTVVLLRRLQDRLAASGGLQVPALLPSLGALV